jgi:fatty acid-binding protein DegV
MTFHPALARGMGQVQVQPEEFFAVVRLLKALQRGGRIDLATALTGTKTKP